MDEILARMLEDLLGRVSGPMKIRFLLQPAMALLLAIRGGLQDARAGNPPYFWSLFTRPEQRLRLVKQGWQSVSRLFLAAIALDAIYQIIELRWIYPAEALAVAAGLAIVPYLLFRGLVTRIAGRLQAASRQQKPAVVSSSAAAAGKR